MNPLVKGEDEEDWPDDQKSAPESGRDHIAKFGRAGDPARPMSDVTVRLLCKQAEEESDDVCKDECADDDGEEDKDGDQHGEECVVRINTGSLSEEIEATVVRRVAAGYNRECGASTALQWLPIRSSVGRVLGSSLHEVSDGVHVAGDGAERRRRGVRRLWKADGGVISGGEEAKGEGTRSGSRLVGEVDQAA